MSSIILNPFQLLELNVISAQDLIKMSRSMRTYAVAWVHPDRKLSTRVDSHGRNNPTWNDKFVFRVDDEFLSSDTAGVMIEIYTEHWFKDKLIGCVRVLVGNLVPPTSRPFRRQQQHGMRFAALQVRRPSGRPQGILNIGVAVLDSSMRSMPLYRQLSKSAVGFLDLMGEDNPLYNHNLQQQQQQAGQRQDQKQEKKKEILPVAAVKPELRRTKSDTSSMNAVRVLKRKVSFREKPNSVISAISDAASPHEKHRRGTSSLPGSMVNASAPASSVAYGTRRKGKYGRAKNKRSEVSSVSPSIILAIDKKFPEVQRADIATLGPNTNLVNKKSAPKPEPIGPTPVNNTAVNKSKWEWNTTASLENSSGISRSEWIQKPHQDVTKKPVPKNLALDFKSANKPKNLYITESELGPSPSEVAAAVAEKKRYRIQMNDGESTAVGEWSVVDSEGLQSKLERWRMDLSPVYDRRGYSKSTAGPASSIITQTEVTSAKGRSRRRQSRDGNASGGLFSCVGNICGCECSIVCGQPSPTMEDH